MSVKSRLTRTWFYFRTGYSFYFVFLISGLNALMIAYFVVILGTECEAGKSLLESGDILCMVRWAFPHFGYFVLFTVAVGVPTLAIVGYFHYQKNQYGTHAHINWRSNPYQKITLELFLVFLDHLKRDSSDYRTNPIYKDEIDEIEKRLKYLLKDKKLDEDPKEDYRAF